MISEQANVNETRTVKITEIIEDDQLKVRNVINPEVVADYRRLYEDGGTLPRPICFEIGGRLLLASGGHRLAGARRAGIEEIEIEVRQGSILDAILFAAGANKEHGARMTRADVRQAIRAILLDKDGARCRTTPLRRSSDAAITP